MMGGGEQLNYLLRLRGTPNGIVDLAGNTITNYNVDYTSTPSTLGGGTALKFNGTDSKLDVTLNSIIASNEDFTLSAWINYSSNQVSQKCSAIISNTALVSSNWSEGDMWFWFTFDQYLYPLCLFYNPSYTDATNIILGDLTSESLNIWHHASVTRNNNVIRVFRDGRLIGSKTNNIKVFNLNNPIWVGADYRNSQNNVASSLNGYLDDICIIKGKALWTSDFTPPTSYLPDRI